jgi:membrane protease YdiL (CAAX protease family)
VRAARSSCPLERFAFLANTQPAERRWSPPLVVLVAGGLLAVIVLAVVMLSVLWAAALVMWAASDGAMSVGRAYGVLSDVGRTGRTLQSYAYELTSVGLGSWAAAWAVIALAARLYRRPFRTFLTAAPRFRWSLVLAGLTIALPIVGGPLAVGYLSGHGEGVAPVLAPGPALWARAVYIAASITFLGMAALAEEVLFRGWLLQQSAVFIRNVGLLLAVNGLLFSAAHFDPDPGAFILRAAMGAAWSWVVLRTGGVEFALGAHLANNLLISLFIKPVSFAPAKRPPTDYRELAVEVAGMLVMVAAVELLVRRRSLGVIAPRTVTEPA